MKLTHHHMSTQDLDHQVAIHQLPIKDLYYIPHTKFHDARGFYAELAQLPALEKKLKAPFQIKQVNHAHSERYVIRGFHAEDWNKLISVCGGKAYKVLIDVRKKSPTFLHTVHITLGNGTNPRNGSMYIPKGVANSVCVVEGPVDYLYCVDSLYQDRDPSGDMPISLFDKDLNITWPHPKEKLIYSDRDNNGISLKEYVEL